MCSMSFNHLHISIYKALYVKILSFQICQIFKICYSRICFVFDSKWSQLSAILKLLRAYKATHLLQYIVFHNNTYNRWTCIQCKYFNCRIVCNGVEVHSMWSWERLSHVSRLKWSLMILHELNALQFCTF